MVLMDFEMPNMNGPTAACEMRAMGYTGVIIGVTGNALPADQLFQSKRADKVLIKQVTIEQVDFTVRCEF